MGKFARSITVFGWIEDGFELQLTSAGMLFFCDALSYAKIIDADQFQVVCVEQPAAAPASPKKPKPKLIISLAAVMGLLAGVSVALVRRAIINRRKLVANEASV